MATYQEWNMEELKGNPLIEALPKYLTLNEFLTCITKKPIFREEERFHMEIERDIYTERLDSCVIPCDEFYITYKRIYKLILKAYENRNPIKTTSPQMMYSIASDGKIPHPYKNTTTSAPSIFITGLSGRGKSYMVEVILDRIFSQLITHEKYKNHALNIRQLLYVKINCPGDASRRALYLKFFHEVDKATQCTNYEEENSNRNLQVIDLERNMKKVCLTHCIALIIIDELQNLSVAKSGGARQTMQFFESIASEAFVSLVFIGTYDCFDIYDGSLKTARKMSKDGVIDLMKLERDDPYWLNLVAFLWNAQWTQNPIRIFPSKNKNQSDYNETTAKGILDALYFCTQGITVCTTTLLKHANCYAIERGIETINEDVIDAVYNTEFKLLHPALLALENNDYDSYNELMPISERIKSMRKEPEASDQADDQTTSTNQEQSDILAIMPDKLKQKKRKSEDASDCENRLKPNGFFCPSIEDFLQH